MGQLRLYVCLLTYLPDCRPTGSGTQTPLSVCLPVCLFLQRCAICIYFSVCQQVCLCACRLTGLVFSNALFVCLPMVVSVGRLRLSICLFVCLTVSLFHYGSGILTPLSVFATVSHLHLFGCLSVAMPECLQADGAGIFHSIVCLSVHSCV